MRASLLFSAAIACSGSPSAAEIADRGWRAHERVIEAGERAATCAEAGAAMQRVFGEHRRAFAEALALEADRAKHAEARGFMAANERRYRDLETRMIALADRCAEDATVAAVFRGMESP